LKSTIINMADRMKDAEDLLLESLFASEAIPDRGFSLSVEKRIRRQLWVRRLSLPIAVLLGGAIAVKPLAGLVSAIRQFLSILPTSVSDSLVNVAIIDLPQLSTFALGAMLAVVAITVVRLLDD